MKLDFAEKSAEKKAGQNATSVGKDMNFAAAEAFKLLRTNLNFSLPDEKKCRIVAITGAQQGVGKSLVALNLAYSTSQAEKRVLLIEADLRMPSISRKTGLKPTPGLSNLLAGANDLTSCVQHYVKNLDVITSGDIPPNPSELLGSHRMQELMAEFSGQYDEIIVDLPPMTIVSDSLVISDFVHGYIVVVRENEDEKASFNEMMRQFEVAKVKVLGFVYNCAENSGKKYGKKKYRHYKNGYYNYDGYYGSSDPSKQ